MSTQVKRESPTTPSAGERLQKVLASAGKGSRRECEELILAGRVEVDREFVTELGTRVDTAQQTIRVDGERLTFPKRVYFVVNKPTGVVCTSRDPSGRMRVIDLVNSNERLFTVGRLDKSSEGLILVTNDGDLANRLTHPRYGVEKTYQVTVAGHPSHEELQQLQKGVRLAEGIARVASVKIRRRLKQNTELVIVLNEGRNREIRRLLARTGHKVTRLRRVAIGPLTLGNLPPGEHRRLSRDEVKELRRGLEQHRRRRSRRGPPSNSPTKKRTTPQAGRSRGEVKRSKAKKEDAPVNNPLHAAFYADAALYQTVDVVENVRVAQDTFRLRFECPQMAARILPGQFLMVRLAGLDDPLIGRPLALYDTVLSGNGEAVGIDVVYVVKGKFTTRLADFVPGQRVAVWGPLGNGFVPQPTQHLIMAAGGIGQTPFVALARESLGRRRYGQPPREVMPVERVTLCYGARTAALLAGVEDFEQAGVEMRLATDDGTRGHHGFVTEVLEQLLAESETACRVVCCGPEPMMEAVSKITARAGIACQVSLETPMACGIGICFTCVAKVREDNGAWDYKRTCVDGPVFDAEKIVW